MNDLPGRLNKTSRSILFFLSLCMIGWIFMEAYRPWIAGLALGAAASLFNAHYLAWKVQDTARRVAQGQPRKSGLGFLTRASVGLLVAATALRFPQHVSFITAAVGLLVFPLVLLAGGIASSLKRKA